MTTTVHLPLCVYCGTARPADISRCPTCGRTWIDIRVGDAVVVGLGASGPAAAKAVATAGAGDGDAAVEPVATSDDDVTEEIPLVAGPPSDPDDIPWDAPPRRGLDLSKWLIPAILAAAVVLVVGLGALGVLDTAPPTTAPAPAAAPVTTLAAPAASAATVPTTTTPPTTTEAPSTTTTVPPPGPAVFTPAGNPLDLSDLSLKAGGIGPLEIGAPIKEVAGRLVASLGTPSATGYADESTGLCPGATGLWLRWGPLTALFDGGLETGTFAGYRYERTPDVPDQPALETLSGLTLGDTVADLNRIYAPYRIEYGPIDGGLGFQLYDGDQLLLWGPITAAEDSGTVLGIYSPMSCSAG